MARPQVIGSVGVTLSGSAGVPADWSTGEYAYDGAGNITAMGGETYTYDKVLRLESSTRNGRETYTFDAFGNLTAMNGLLRTTDPATNRLTEASYDRRGNLVAWGGYAFTWDTMGRMTSMQGPGINRSMFYDANGERIVVRDGSGYTFTLRDLGQEVLREVSWSSATGWRWGKDYVYRDGVLLASQSTSAGEGLRYHFPDHVTSPRLVTNRCGERAVEHRVSSFGVDVLSGSSQVPDRMRFTMHERDLGQLSTTVDDLDYMHARTYWPSLGRFMSVDPLRGTPARPQSFNLFGYVEGRPVSFIDPWGLQAYDLGLRDTIQVMGEDPCPEAPPGVSCADYRTANQFMRRMLWESARRRAQEREDPMLAIMREVGSLARDATPPCHSMSFGKKWAINMDKTYGGLSGFALDPSVDTAVKWGGWVVATVPTGSYVSTGLGWPTFVQWALSGFAPTTSSGVAFTALETGVLVGGNSLVAGAIALPAYAVGTSIGSAYQAWAAPCEAFW